MTSNHTDVVPDLPPSPYDDALADLAHIGVVEQEIDILAGHAERSTAGLIADRHREIGSTFKRAEIYATLAVADSIANLTRTLATIAAPAEGAPASHSRRIFETAMVGRDRGRA